MGTGAGAPFGVGMWYCTRISLSGAFGVIISEMPVLSCSDLSRSVYSSTNFATLFRVAFFAAFFLYPMISPLHFLNLLASAVGLKTRLGGLGMGVLLLVTH